MADGVESRLARVEEQIKNMRTDWSLRFATTDALDRLRDECRQGNREHEEYIVDQLAEMNRQARADHKEQMDKLNEHLPTAEIREYAITQTKATEQTIQVTAANLDKPLWKLVGSAIISRPWLLALTLALSTALLNGLIGFLQKLSAVLETILQHTLHS